MPHLSTPAQAIRRLLIIRNDRLGDLMLTLPAIAAARRALPGATITLLAGPLAAPILAGHPDIDELLIDDPHDGAWRLGRRMRGLFADAGLAINYSRRACSAMWLARIPRRIAWGYKLTGCLAANGRVWLHRSRPPIHEADFALAFIRALGIEIPRQVPLTHLPIQSEARATVRARIQRELGGEGPLVIVHPGGRGSAYYWPEENFTQLIRLLAPRMRLILTGTRPERPLLSRLLEAAASGRERISAWDDLELPQLAAAIAECRCVVAGGTGPLHVAAAVGTPVVGLYSAHPAQAPAKWGPLGAGHIVLQAPLAAGEDPHIPAERAAAHMARISVDQVLAAVNVLANRSRAA